MKKTSILNSALVILLVMAAILYGLNYKSSRSTSSNQLDRPKSSPPNQTSNQIDPNALAEPVTDFKVRVSKKPFDLHVTPQNSPIQPERFTGFHTGADAEYQDVTTDVPVYAVADGQIVLARTASGYGGVMIEEIELNGIKRTILYGHIRPSSLPKINQTVKKGEQIGLLGTGYSSETDGERRHLHLAILSDNRLDLKGYVQDQSQLALWLDPLGFF